MKHNHCPNCGLDLDGKFGPHSCAAGENHDAWCQCIYCVGEQRFADGVFLASTAEEKELDTLDALIAEWNLVQAEYIDADFDRREELVDVIERLSASLAEYLDVRRKRKFLQEVCKKNHRIKAAYGNVCRERAWFQDFERALRLS